MISIEALYTSIGGTPCKNFPLSVVRLYYDVVISCLIIKDLGIHHFDYKWIQNDEKFMIMMAGKVLKSLKLELWFGNFWIFDRTARL